MHGSSKRLRANKNRIIVIDSDVASNNALTKMLADESETFFMPDVVTALDWSTHWPPELILLGRSVIAMEGAGAVARFKRHVPGVKILIVCDALDNVEVRQAQLHGADSTLLRPFGRNAVEDKVHEMIAPRSLRQVTYL